MIKRKYLFICLAMALAISVKAYNQPSYSQSANVVKLIKPEEIYGIKLVPVPAGTFRMGSEDMEDDEKPARTIRVNGFEMSATEITQRQYESVMGENPSHFAGNDDFPVERVTWYDAVKFCNALSVHKGLDRCYNETTWKCDFAKNGFRLPTEAEWEYACRAGTTTEYYTGDNEKGLAGAGWYGYDKGNSNKSTHPVARKEPNAWGLYDMHGNVFEWVNDWYGEYDSDSIENPVGPDSATYKVLRGGSWFSLANYCRSAFRINDRPERTSNFSGFRIVMSKNLLK